MSAAKNATLPAGLEDGRYVLFVSTIEPRKGHAMLLRVWTELLAAGIPQAHSFKLVFVGRRGWMTDELQRTMAEDRRLAGSLVRLEGLEDATLDLVYRRAAFCVYPSLYEGYGLPVVEAFARGKAVLASSGGALAEVAAGYSPTLDPEDEDAWFESLRSWIEDESARRPYEAAIARSFRAPTWETAAAQFFAATLAE